MGRKGPLTIRWELFGGPQTWLLRARCPESTWLSSGPVRPGARCPSRSGASLRSPDREVGQERAPGPELGNGADRPPVSTVQVLGGAAVRADKAQTPPDGAGPPLRAPKPSPPGSLPLGHLSRCLSLD